MHSTDKSNFPIKSTLINQVSPLTHLAFDMDGVLFSAEPFIEDTYRTAIAKSGLKLREPSTKEIIAQFGNPVRLIFANLFGELSEKQFRTLQPLIIESITEAIRNGRGEIYPGVLEIIEELSAGYTLAVCSNAGSQYVSSILEKYNLARFFVPVLTLTGTAKKNKTELLCEYLKITGTTSKNWMMFGDRSSDLTAARENGCRFTGCLWGFGNRDELEGADMLIDTPGEIIGTLRETLAEKVT